VVKLQDKMTQPGVLRRNHTHQEEMRTSPTTFELLERRYLNIEGPLCKKKYLPKVRGKRIEGVYGLSHIEPLSRETISAAGKIRI